LSGTFPSLFTSFPYFEGTRKFIGQINFWKHFWRDEREASMTFVSGNLNGLGTSLPNTIGNLTTLPPETGYSTPSGLTLSQFINLSGNTGLATSGIPLSPGNFGLAGGAPLGTGIGSLPGQGTGIPTMPGMGLPGQGTGIPTMPGMGLPGQGTGIPTMPGMGLPGQGTGIPTMPGMGEICYPTMPGTGLPGQGTGYPTMPGMGLPGQGGISPNDNSILQNLIPMMNALMQFLQVFFPTLMGGGSGLLPPTLPMPIPGGIPPFGFEDPSTSDSEDPSTSGSGGKGHHSCGSKGGHEGGGSKSSGQMDQQGGQGMGGGGSKSSGHSGHHGGKGKGHHGH
jgi:hypothetical protein